MMEKQSVKDRVQELLEFTNALKHSGLTWVEANNAIYGPGGRFVQLFPSKNDRAAFAKTEASRQIDTLIDSLPEPGVRPSRQEYSGKFVVRVPKSLHAALAAEAEAEGVSLNQLVVAKLSTQLAGTVKS
jgi:predicted HicB family RNase H-like nuclease